MKDLDWSFNLRKFDPSAFDDSDFEDDVVHDKRVSPSATQAAQSFDLSTREESVTYKPNPFSIAKINAACRSGSAKDRENALLPKSKLTGPVRPVVPKQVQEKKVSSATVMGDSKGKRNSTSAAKAGTMGPVVLPRQKLEVTVQRRAQAPTASIVRVKSRQEESLERTNIIGASSAFDPSIASNSAARLPPPSSQTAPQMAQTYHSRAAKQLQMRQDQEVLHPHPDPPHIVSQIAPQAALPATCEKKSCLCSRVSLTRLDCSANTEPDILRHSACLCIWPKAKPIYTAAALCWSAVL